MYHIMYYMYFNNVDLPDALHLNFVRQKVQRTIQKTIKLGKLILTNNLNSMSQLFYHKNYKGRQGTSNIRNSVRYMKCPRDLIKMQAQLKVE